jgi:putative methionine-R-sulfoxide reductase with GAF domain
MDPLGTNPAPDIRELKPAVRDRRRRVRQKVHTPAYASLDGGSGGMVLDLSEILDLSEEGMCLQTAVPLQAGRDLNFCLDLSESNAYIHTSGHVIWADQPGRAGIRFPQMPDTSLRQLKEWLFLNAITACMNHAASKTPPAETEALKDLSQEPNVEAAALEQGELPVPPDYTSVLAGLAAVKREVESLGVNLDAALEMVAHRAHSFTHATGAAIALSEGDAMVCRATAGPDAPGLGARLQVGSGFSGECVRTGRLLRCDDAETDPRVDRESCRLLGIRSMIAVPIRLGDAVIGLLEVFSPQPGAFSENDNIVLQRLAETTLAAVNRAAHAATVSGRLFEPAPGAVEEQASADSPSQPESPGQSSSSLFHKILLSLAALTLFLVLAWLAAPWARFRTGATPAGASPASKPQVVAPRLPGTSTESSDLESLRKLAEQGDPAAQFAVGARYATGEDVKQDYGEAVHWFAQAAEQGHVIAQATLGAYYWAGRGVPQDLSKAYFWSILAQAGGDEASKYRVAVLASRMTRAQVIAAQQQANDWLKQHQLAGKKASGAR